MSIESLLLGNILREKILRKHLTYGNREIFHKIKVTWKVREKLFYPNFNKDYLYIRTDGCIYGIKSLRKTRLLTLEMYLSFMKWNHDLTLRLFL